MRLPRLYLLLSVCFISFPLCSLFASKIVFLAGEPSHGWGEHEFVQGADLLAKCLNQSNLELEAVVFEGWSDEVMTLELGDVLVLYSDGIDAHVAKGHSDSLRTLYEQGIGIAVLHFALEPPSAEDDLHAFFQESVGGCFEVNWSVNPIWRVKSPILSTHPVTSGVEPFDIEDEWYFHMRFNEDEHGVFPVMSSLAPVSSLGDNGPRSGNPTVRSALENEVPQILAWVREQPNGKRGFGFTGGHFHHNWRDVNVRKLVLNGILWCTGMEIPEGGVESTVQGVVRYQTIEEAIARKDLIDVRSHIEADPSVVNRSGRGGFTPLHVAVMRKNLSVVELLLEHGSNPSQQTNAKETTLHLAANRATPDFCRMLMNAGVDSTVLDKQGWTALHNAAAKNKVDIARELLACGARVDTLSAGGGTPLHEAAASGSREMVELLLAHHCNPSVVSKTGVTALDLAEEYENEGAIEALRAHAGN